MPNHSGVRAMTTEGPHDPDSLRAWLRAESLTEEELARLLDLSVYTLAGWRTGRRRIRPIVARALRDVGRSREVREPWAAMLRDGGHEAFEGWRIDRGLTLRAIIRRLPADPRVVYAWARGRKPLSVVAVRAMRDFDREWRRQQPKPRA